MKKRIFSSTLTFIVLMGIVSLLSDMTHEGARSIYGPFLYLSGASATVIGFISGLGEFIGNSLILLTGWIADKTKKYWLMTIIGYTINLLAIPALALVPENGWMLACSLILVERIGRAIRKPSKSTMVSFASKELGAGKTFAILEFMDQIGAFLGPFLLFFVLLFKGENSDFNTYRLIFVLLGIPAILTLIVLFIAKKKFPNPSNFEPDTKIKNTIRIENSFVFYLIAISFFAFGFIDFPLISLHISKLSIISNDVLPLLYALAMIVDAFAALFFGWIFDKYGIKVLILSTILSSTFAIFVFSFSSIGFIILGIMMWGIGMGAQESILKSTVAMIIPKENRSVGFGVFEMVFGLAWFAGSWLLGYLYDVNILLMISISVTVQLLSIPFYFMVIKTNISV
ncbi:MAG: MFS transporter [Erysipelothrix sp.]|jgi:MFS family permease|nr:MFS transporter [Erysipelothrix sp.]